MFSCSSKKADNHKSGTMWAVMGWNIPIKQSLSSWIIIITNLHSFPQAFPSCLEYWTFWNWSWQIPTKIQSFTENYQRSLSNCHLFKACITVTMDNGWSKKVRCPKMRSIWVNLGCIWIDVQFPVHVFVQVFSTCKETLGKTTIGNTPKGGIMVEVNGSFPLQRAGVPSKPQLCLAFTFLSLWDPGGEPRHTIMNANFVCFLGLWPLPGR